jgi:hypothetical protein
MANVVEAGAKDYVYQIKLNVNASTPSGFFGFWGSYPFKLQDKASIFDWTFDHIRVHYPAEHTFENGTIHYDMEM